MKTVNKRKGIAEKLIFTAVAVVLLIGIVLTMLNYVYYHSEQEAFDVLHYETQQFKRDINLQFMSDRENLETMARFAEQLYAEGKDYSLLFDSFREIGLFESIGVLLPDNRFITKNGVIKLGDGLDFTQEAAKGKFVTGRVNSLSKPGMEVVRSAVAIRDKDDRPVAMMYGIVNLETFKERYYDSVKAKNADLYIIERGNGNLVLNTKTKSIRNLEELAQTKFGDGYSYAAFADDISRGQDGIVSFDGVSTKERLYAHYAPMEIEDWHIMMTQPADVVLATARRTTSYMMLVACLIFLVMLLYALLLFISERKNLVINRLASDIRKVLLGIQRKSDGIYDALHKIVVYSRARSAFVTDSHGIEHSYIIPGATQSALTEEERTYFVSQLFAYVSKKRTQYHNELYLSKITAGAALEKIMPEFSDFMKAHGIESVCFACVANDNASVSILGVLNSKNKRVYALLEDIAICFTMAIHNQKDMAKTEEMAHTDALTGVANRMAYKEDIVHLEQEVQENMICIFVDVNELNYFNNTYGHTAGDQMLMFIAQVLSDTFTDGRVYRIGGDEFLVFVWNLSEEELQNRIAQANAQIEEMKYHISVGVQYGNKSMHIEEIVNAAEKAMYVEKAKYYQTKEFAQTAGVPQRAMETAHTGVGQIDAFMSALSCRYSGVCCVMHESDTAISVLMSSYFSEALKTEQSFSQAWAKYVHDYVHPESRRVLQHFLDFAALERQFASGHLPSVTYKKLDGVQVKLTVYPNADSSGSGIDSVWIFEDLSTSEGSDE